MAFKRGDKVLCIKKDTYGIGTIFQLNGDIPLKGKTYTVSNPSVFCECAAGILLEECGFCTFSSQAPIPDLFSCGTCIKLIKVGDVIGWDSLCFVKISGEPDEADKADVFETKLLETPKTLLEV